MTIVTREAHFNAAHRLFNPKFSQEKNEEIFGPCANHYGHGHNYVIAVSLIGVPDQDTGYVVDLKKLKELIDFFIVKPCDHKHLNYQVDFLKDVIPTVENLSESFFKRLLPEISKITNAKLYSVKVWETQKNYAEYRSD